MKGNELKCSDLRIGNYLKYNSKIVEVFGLRPRYIEYYDEDEFLVGDNPEYFEPIELTEELLVKIGFELVNTKRLAGYELVKELENNVYEFFVFKIFDNNDTLLNIRKQKGGGFEYGEFTKRGIKYLHELQNAYYLLTNEELEVEL